MQTVPHDLGFILCPSTPCGLSSCFRNSPHFHCRFCIYGTSQIANAIAHGRLCGSIPQKDYSLNAEAIYQSAQPFSYYPPATQTSSTSSKIITTQQSTMLSFVLPSQNQFSGIYGPQTVFPNTNLFSPSGFSNYGQMDSTWVSQGRLMPSAAASSVADSSAASQNNCCPLGVPSPDKLSNKDLQTPWSSNSVTHQKFLDTPASCQISLLFLEHSKDSEECIDVDDICLTPKPKDTADCLDLEVKANEKDNYLGELKTEAKTCLPKSPIVDVCLGQITPKHKLNCLDQMSPNTKSFDGIEQQPQSTSSNETDIIVEESNSDSDGDVLFKHCTVCEAKPSINAFTPITANSPLTSTSKTPIYQKLIQILDQTCLEQSSICSRCVDLLNLIDSLEVKLSSSINEIRTIYKDGQFKHAEGDFDDGFICKMCDKSFSSLIFFEKHQRNHTESIKYCCEFCGKGFEDEEKLQNHVRLHEQQSDILRFQCEICGKQFSDKVILSNHIFRHKNERQYECNFCPKIFRQRTMFREHVKIHEGAGYVCQHCGRHLKNLSNLKVHIKICSNALDFECDKCDKKFPLKSLLSKHVELKHMQNIKFQCELCHRGFWKESDLKSHLISHRSDKPFKCKTCGNAYKSKKNLNHHMKIHEIQQNCRFCGKNFTRAEALADHINSHTGRQPYECVKCGKKFANRITFNSHLQRHNAVGAGLQCVVCKEIIEGEMSEHLKLHKEKQSFQCRICLSDFAFKNSLIKHFKRKHSDLLTVQFDVMGPEIAKHAIFV